MVGHLTINLTEDEKNNEVWVDVVNFNNYEVSNFGRIRNKIKGNFLKQCFSNRGYVRVSLAGDGFRKTEDLHRIIARAFHNCDESGLVVDHIDRNKTNNKPSNLRWVTHKENCRNRIYKKRFL